MESLSKFDHAHMAAAEVYAKLSSANRLKSGVHHCQGQSHHFNRV